MFIFNCIFYIFWYFYIFVQFHISFVSYFLVSLVFFSTGGLLSPPGRCGCCCVLFFTVPFTRLGSLGPHSLFTSVLHFLFLSAAVLGVCVYVGIRMFRVELKYISTCWRCAMIYGFLVHNARPGNIIMLRQRRKERSVVARAIWIE